MKARMMIAPCLALLLSSASTIAQAKHRHMDVTMEGPWILYEDKQFDDNGKKVTVIVAIAPSGAINYPQNAGDDIHHHVPQLSTGDGYFIKKPDVYCLTFDGKCAPRGPASLKPDDDYPQTVPLTVTYHAAKDAPATWDWALASKGHTVLILPVPDSYTNDGVWHMRFANKFNEYGDHYGSDTQHSIGLHLHYANGPTLLNILACQGRPTTANCTKPPTEIPHTQLENTGTLRILMKAPDSDDGCDRHVRHAYHEMFRFLNNNFNPDKAYIEPAQVDANGNFKYEDRNNNYCFKRDPQNPRKQGGILPSDAMAIPAENSALEVQIGEIVKSIGNLALPPDSDKDALLSPAKEAQTASVGLDPNFPRISQMLRIGQLLRVSETAIESVEASSTDPAVRNELAKIEAAEERISNGPPTKSGGDCRAPIMLVKP